MRALRPDQSAALNALREAVVNGHKHMVMQGPTGIGKTVIAAELISNARRKNKKVLFTVPAISLVDQTAEMFASQGIDGIGVLQADHRQTDSCAPVQVASVQTLQRREMPDADVIILDEVHRWYECFGKWMRNPEIWLNKPVIGLSATPWRRGLGNFFSKLLIASTTQELIDKGLLSDFKVFSPGHPDLSGIKMVAGEYHEGELSERMSKIKLVADAVETWLEHGRGRPTLCFAVDCAHAKKLQEQFVARGVRVAYQDAFTKSADRAAIKRGFHDGSIEVVVNCETLLLGVDWDVRCIVLCRPTKSDMLFNQLIGRGLRTAKGKDYCLTRDTLVLTNKGEVKIQDVTLEHKVWDGRSFVSHAGAVCKGIKAVISYDGITATPDHKVMTDEGWKPLSEAARRGLRITRTGIGGKPIWFANDSFEQDRSVELQPAGRGILRALWRQTYGSFSQYPETPQDSGMSMVQWTAAGYGPALALSAMPKSARSLRQSTRSPLQILRWAWDQISFYLTKRSGKMDRAEFGHQESFNAVGSYRQRWALRAGKLALGSSGAKHEQYQMRLWSGALHCISEILSRSEICRQDTSQAYFVRPIGRGYLRALAGTVTQTEREVWDILNAGPLQRFTANGRLVHNCLVLDHSDNHLRLGFVTDIDAAHTELCKGDDRTSSATDRIRLPKECPSCSFLKPPGMAKCPMCQHVAVAHCKIEPTPGELKEIERIRKAAEEVTDKAMFYAELKAYANERGYNPHWADNKYREKFGVWPNAYKRIDPAVEISIKTRSWIKSRQIAWAKSRHNPSYPQPT